MSGGARMISVREVGSIVFPPSSAARVMAVLRAYFDESGLHENPGVFTIAGYVAPEEEWDKNFSPKWREMLGKPDIKPPLEYFRAADVEGLGSKRFRAITQRERDHLKVDAVNIVVNSGVLGIASAVIMDSYNKFVIGKVREIVGDQYLLCFQHVITEVVNLSRAFLGEDPNEKIAFIFDRHPRWDILAREMYQKMVDKEEWINRYRLGTITFGDKKQFTPLQAADHLAYETYLCMTDPRALRPAMRRFLGWPQHHGRYFDDEGCQSFIQELKNSGKI